MSKKLQSVFGKIIICIVFVFSAGCNQNPSNELLNNKSVKAKCKSVHKNEDLTSNLSASKIKYKVPVSRSRNDKNGWATVLLVNNNSGIQIYWSTIDPQQRWQIADKQTVTSIKPGELDVQPMHRLNEKVYPKNILFVSIPDAMWQQLNSQIIPVVKKPDFKWGKVRNYKTRITAQGIVHPFRGIEEASSGQILSSPRLNKILNAVEPGSIYVPERYNSNLIGKPISANKDICPVGKVESKKQEVRSKK